MKSTNFILAILAMFVLGAFADPSIYPLGEKLTYRIMWNMFPVGQTVIQCEALTDHGADSIRVRVQAKSNRLVSALYPVNDLIDCYINRTTGLPYRVEKQTSEGKHLCDDTLQLDHAKGLAVWQSRSASISTNYPIYSDTLDVSSFLYAIRTYSFTLRKPKTFHVAADGTLHGLTITAEQKKMLKTTLSDEKILCTRYSVVPERKDLFVRKIPGDVWVTDDDRRIMVKMKAKTPLGNVRIVLDEVLSINIDERSS